MIRYDISMRVKASDNWGVIQCYQKHAASRSFLAIARLLSCNILYLMTCRSFVVSFDGRAVIGLLEKVVARTLAGAVAMTLDTLARTEMVRCLCCNSLPWYVLCIAPLTTVSTINMPFCHLTLVIVTFFSQPANVVVVLYVAYNCRTQVTLGVDAG